MKNLILSAFLGLGTAFCLHAADGDSFSWQGLDFTVLSEAEKTCEVGKNADKASGDVVIPAKAVNNGTEYTVTALGADAFFLNTTMTSISIPETVTTIKSQALSRCIGLTELVIPDNVTTMESRACYANNYITHLTISSGMREIVRETFSGCPNLEEIIIPDGVVTIHDEAFNYCARVKRLVIGGTVESIGTMSFAGLGALTSVSIPASVRNIGREAFSYCPKIATVTLEESPEILTFGINAFGETTYMGGYDDPVAKINEININRPFTCTSDDPKEMPFAHKPTLTTVNIGNTAPTLPLSAFAACDAITAVNIKSDRCPAASTSTFSSAAYAGATLTVPANAIDKYREHSVWRLFAKIEGAEADPEPDPNHPAKPWLISETDICLEAGSTTQLSAVAAEEGYEPECTIEWTSSDETVATVADNGLVTAVAEGQAEISMLVSTGEGLCYFETCNVTVNARKDSIDTILTGTTADGALYDMNGHRVTATPAATGIYILRMADGTTKKIIFK